MRWATTTTFRGTLYGLATIRIASANDLRVSLIITRSGSAAISTTVNIDRSAIDVPPNVPVLQTVADSFDDINGTLLQNHLTDEGKIWDVTCGDWIIGPSGSLNQAINRPPTGRCYALVDLGADFTSVETAFIPGGGFYEATLVVDVVDDGTALFWAAANDSAAPAPFVSVSESIGGVGVELFHQDDFFTPGNPFTLAINRIGTVYDFLADGVSLFSFDRGSTPAVQLVGLHDGKPDEAVPETGTYQSFTAIGEAGVATPGGTTVEPGVPFKLNCRDDGALVTSEWWGQSDGAADITVYEAFDSMGCENGSGNKSCPDVDPCHYFRGAIDRAQSLSDRLNSLRAGDEPDNPLPDEPASPGRRNDYLSYRSAYDPERR